jgi:hypothetical protein
MRSVNYNDSTNTDPKRTDIIEQNNKNKFQNYVGTNVPLPGVDPLFDKHEQKINAQTHRNEMTKAGFPGGKAGMIIAENVIKNKAKKSLLKRGFSGAARLLGRIGSLPVQAFFLGMGTAYAPNKNDNEFEKYRKETNQEAYAKENEGLTEAQVRTKDNIANAHDYLKNVPVTKSKNVMLSQGK